MKTIKNRRIRHHAQIRENSRLNHERQKDSFFFGENTHNPFFNPVIRQNAAGISSEDASIHRKKDEKEEDKKIQWKQINEQQKAQKLVDEKEESDKKIQRQEEEEETIQMKTSNVEMQLNTKDSPMQRKATPKARVGSATSYLHSLNGKGQPLPNAANAFFSHRMGYDFNNVKIHTNRDASDSAKSLQAKAYTVKNHIVFKEGAYNTQSTEGKKLLAHELTHVMQQNSDNQLKRKEDADNALKENIRIPTFFQRGVVWQNTRHFANCSGVSVEGHTDANYGNSFTAPGTSTPVTDCDECASNDCVTNSGTVISVFTTNPRITLPSVPSGLNECEQNAVQRFINTTLRSHEQQHVAAFNTYRGRVRTPYEYRGCASGLDAYLQQIHDGVETARKTSSDAASAALDVGGANVFNVNCDCPDSESESAEE